MINYIVVGKSNFVVVAVLQALRSFTDAKVLVIGDHETDVLRWSSLCHKKRNVRFDGQDDKRFAELVNTLARKMPHLKLIPADCEGIRIVNRVRNRLCIGITPIPDTATLNMFDDKWQFHRFCTEHGLRVPETRLIGAKEEIDFDAIVAELGLPFVLKPINQAGSLGVQIVTGKDYFERVIRDNPAYDFKPLIAQRFIAGADIDLSLLAVDGKLSAFAIQQVSGSKVHFVPNTYLETLAGRICDESRYSGPMHVDARIEKHTGQVYLIESNPRFWASVTASVWCGLNFVAESIEPTPRPSGPRRLTYGSAHTRHPMLRPASWPRLVFDTHHRGRLLRTTTFDPYLLSHFLCDLPVLLWRYAHKGIIGRVIKYPALKKV